MHIPTHVCIYIYMYIERDIHMSSASSMEGSAVGGSDATSMCLPKLEACGIDYGCCSNKDPAKSGLGPKRSLNVDGGFLSAPYNYVVQHVHHLDSRISVCGILV